MLSGATRASERFSTHQEKGSGRSTGIALQHESLRANAPVKPQRSSLIRRAGSFPHLLFDAFRGVGPGSHFGRHATGGAAVPAFGIRGEQHHRFRALLVGRWVFRRAGRALRR